MDGERLKGPTEEEQKSHTEICKFELSSSAALKGTVIILAGMSRLITIASTCRLA